MGEERIVSADVGISLKSDLRTRKGIPGTCGERESWRANGQQINHHELAVSVPAGGKKAGLRGPALGEGGAAIQHPGPVDTLVDLSGKTLDLRILKILPAGEHAAQQDGGIDRRHFGVERPLAS